MSLTISIYGIFKLRETVLQTQDNNIEYDKIISILDIEHIFFNLFA